MKIYGKIDDDYCCIEEFSFSTNKLKGDIYFYELNNFDDIIPVNIEYWKPYNTSITEEIWIDNDTIYTYEIYKETHNINYKDWINIRKNFIHKYRVKIYQEGKLIKEKITDGY